MNKLSGNQLKLIALISMTIDHIGKAFFSFNSIFEIIGRLSFPIFAYMVAEGWRYTSNKKKYMSMIWGMGILYQIVYYVFYDSLYMGIFITYGLSLLLIFAIEYLLDKKKNYFFTAPLIILLVVFVGCVEYIYPSSGFAVDFGIIGILIPVIVYFFKTKLEKLCILFIMLCLLVLMFGVVQIFALASVFLLAFYSGQRGNKNLKYLFYAYYPLHLVVIWMVNLFV